MDIKKAIYELRTRFKNVFITRTTQATVTINANTNARVNATIPTVNGYKPIAIKGLKNSNGTDGVITEFDVYSDTIVTSVIRNVSSAQKSYTITYTVLYVKEIFVGGGITLAISTLSASERGCWRHEYQTDAICALAKDNKGRKLFYDTNSCKRNWNCALGQGGTNHSRKCEQSSSREYSNSNITRKVQTIPQCVHLYIRPEPNKKNTIKYNITRGTRIIQLWECYNRKYKRFSDNHLHSNVDCLTVRGCVA